MAKTHQAPNVTTAMAETVLKAAEKSADPPVVRLGAVGNETKLHFGKVEAAVKMRNHWFATIPAGTVLETILEPAYWAHYARDRIRPMDLIEAFCEDGSWEALLRVMYVGKIEVNLSIISRVQHDQPVNDADADIYYIKWVSPSVKYAVKRRDTDEVVQSGFFPKSKAIDYMRRHLAKLKQ